MKASVVIPTYNKIGRLKLVVESLKYQTASTEDFEVVFVDDGSDDGNGALFRERKFSVSLQCGRAESYGPCAY